MSISLIGVTSGPTGPTGPTGSTGATGATGAAGAILAINAQTGTTYTLVAGDLNDLVTLNNAGAITLTIPPSVFSANDSLSIAQIGAGQVTFAQGAGVTINSTGATATAPKCRARYSAATVICTASNTFLVVGDIA
jgi:CubicO group peptidase (beta-lactamase class C family)